MQWLQLCISRKPSFGRPANGSSAGCVLQVSLADDSHLVTCHTVFLRVWFTAPRAPTKSRLLIVATGGRTQLVVDHSCPTLPQLRAEFLEACHRRGLAVPSEFAADPSTNKTIFRWAAGGRKCVHQKEQHKCGIVLISWLYPVQVTAPVVNNALFLKFCREEDNEFAKLWQQYHAQHARLRLLCKACLWQTNGRRGIPQCKGRLLMPDKREQAQQQEWRRLCRHYLRAPS